MSFFSPSKNQCLPIYKQYSWLDEDCEREGAERPCREVLERPVLWQEEAGCVKEEGRMPWVEECEPVGQQSPWKAAAQDAPETV